MSAGGLIECPWPNSNGDWNLELRFPLRSKSVSTFVFLALSAALVLAAGCSQGDASDADTSGEGGESGDMALVWEAWDALMANYAAPESLDESAVVGGAIRAVLELGDLEPYPALVQVGRMRGQVPGHVPDAMVDLWRVTQLYQAENTGTVDSEAVEIIIRGMVQALPERASGYLTAEQVPEAEERLERRVEGSYVGIGAMVDSRAGQILLFPFPGSPAEKAEIENGDVLLAVEGVPVGNATPSEVGDRIKGEEGTKVLLELQRTGEPEPIELEVFRGNVERPSVTRRLTQGGIAYIRIDGFRDNTGHQVFDALEELRQYDALALILDLRFNPGGSGEAAAEVAALFLPPGGLFRTIEGRDGIPAEQALPELERRLSIDEVPVAVLVDNRTVGEAEALAAALREADRATLVGLPTFGEGSIYDLVSLSDGSAIYIPTQRWSTPGGSWLGDRPLQPDIVVEYEEVLEGPGGEMQFNAAYEYLDSQLPLFR